MLLVPLACLSLAMLVFLLLLDLATTPVGSTRMGGNVQADAGLRPQAEAMCLSPTARAKRPASLDEADSATDRRRA